MTKKEFLEYMSLGISLISLLFVFIGFFRPVIMLWWEDEQNRKKVLKYYGTTAVFFYLTYWVIRLFW